MPEAKVLYAVTAAVVSGLVVWVLVVLKTAKEPWLRAHAPGAEAGGSEDASPPEPALATESARESAEPEAPPKSDA